MKNDGFTLVELLAIIVVLGVIITFTSINVVGLISNSKDKTNNEQLNQIKDAALIYAVDARYSLAPCNSFDIESCEYRTIKLNDLITNKYFKDDAKICKVDADIIIYMSADMAYNIYIPDESICQK